MCSVKKAFFPRVLGGVLVGIAAFSSQAWADTLTSPQSTERAMSQEQIHKPTASDYERLNNRNRTESRMMNKQSHGVETGIQHQYDHQYRYGSGGMSRDGMAGGGVSHTNQGARGR